MRNRIFPLILAFIMLLTVPVLAETRFTDNNGTGTQYNPNTAQGPVIMEDDDFVGFWCVYNCYPNDDSSGGSSEPEPAPTPTPTPKLDVAATAVTYNDLIAGRTLLVYVKAENKGEASITTSVKLMVGDTLIGTESVTLAVGESRLVPFVVAVPTSGSITLKGEVNQERVFEETDYGNNIVTVSGASVSNPDIPPDTVSCGDTIIWSENDSHMVEYTDASGNRRSYECTHTLTYQTKLATTHRIDPKILKSGYGFAVELDCTITTTMLSNVGGCTTWGNSRVSAKTPVPPNQAQVKTNWTVQNRLGRQASTIDLNLLSRTATVSKFEPKSNPISEKSAKLIYTDVALAGTETRPAQHPIQIVITGGGVNSVQFCKTIQDNITIKGDMYSDDHTGTGK